MNETTSQSAIGYRSIVKIVEIYKLFFCKMNKTIISLKTTIVAFCLFFIKVANLSVFVVLCLWKIAVYVIVSANLEETMSRQAMKIQQ